MTIKVNGQSLQASAPSIDTLLRELNLPEQGVAVALNGQVVRRTEQPTTALHEGDEVEIIHAVQGG